MFQIGGINIFEVRNIVPVDLCQKIIFPHTLDHIVGRTDHIVGNGAGQNLRIHDFVCFEFLINHLDSGFFCKQIKNLRIKIFPPVIDNDLFLGYRACRAQMMEKSGYCDEKNHGSRDDLIQRCFPFLFGRGRDCFFICFFWRDVDQNHDHHNRKKQ